MNILTKKTNDFYDNYPCPQLSDKRILSNSKAQNKLLFGMGIPEKLLSKSLKVLDAGCGTGSFALSFALANKKCEVTAFNISQSSIDYATNQQKSLNIKNVNFLKADIFNLSEEISSKKYDIVYCRGVLHHTFNPKLGLEILSKLVKPNCYMVIGLYHKGRYKVRAMRFILRLLAGNNYKKCVKIARKLFPKHCHNHVTKSFENESLSRRIEDVYLADKFAVPKESYHSFLFTNLYLRKLGFEILYKNVAKPEKRIRREKLIHKIVSLLPIPKSIKEDLADDLIGLTVCKEMFLVVNKKIG